MRNTSDFMLEGLFYNLVFEVLKLNWEWLEYDIYGFAKEATTYSLWRFHDWHRGTISASYIISLLLSKHQLYVYMYIALE